MQDGEKLVNKVAHALEASATTTRTAAGQAETKLPTSAHIDAINQIFMLFRVNYHNQYYAAYNDTDLLNQAKKLWLESLKKHSPDIILNAARKAIEDSEYLPTLHKMLEFCHPSSSELGLPDVHSAYQEACQAPSPKNMHNWSHAAVYLAGQECDWFFLAGTPEIRAFPVFKRHYELLCKRAMEGEILVIPHPPALPDESHHALPKDEQLTHLEQLRKETGI